MHNIKLVYITAPNKIIAREIAKALVINKLAACVNIVGAVESFYLWEEKLSQGEEVLILAKTNNEDGLTKLVKEIHPYECPCIISFEISSGYNKFIEWIEKS